MGAPAGAQKNIFHPSAARERARESFADRVRAGIRTNDNCFALCSPDYGQKKIFYTSAGQERIGKSFSDPKLASTTPGKSFSDHKLASTTPGKSFFDQVRAGFRTGESRLTRFLPEHPWKKIF